MAEAVLHQATDDEALSYVSEASEPAKKKSRRSVKESLKDDMSVMENKFASLDSKLDRLTNLLSERANSFSDADTYGVRGPLQNLDTTDNVPLERRPQVYNNIDLENQQQADQLSLNPGQQEMNDFNEENSVCGSEDRFSHDHLVATKISNDRFRRNLSEENKNVLMDLFGEDAMTIPTVNDIGLRLDDSQIKILESGWNCENPSHLTAYKDEYRINFPVSTHSQEILSVPKLDGITKQYHLTVKV